MKIIRSGLSAKLRATKGLMGNCIVCGCVVKCWDNDPAILPYSRSNPILRVNCPTPDCGNIIILRWECPYDE